MPVLGASWNSQMVQRLQDALAAIAQVGGATIYGNALALSRLPQTVADAVFSATAYPSALQAIAVGDAPALRAAYRLALRAHLAVMMPTAAAVLVAGDAAAAAVYAHGKCSAADVARISQVLWWAAPGMVAISLQCIHSQLLVATGRSGALLRIELGLSVLSIAGSFAAMSFLGLGGIIAGHSTAQCLIQIPMLLILARAGLRWQDTVAELVRALVPALVAAFLALGVELWLGHGVGPWTRAMVVGGTVLLITGPCSAWAIRHPPQPPGIR
jgi:peptidoglycan biosynthesis protein MviN/MurJ (putative lipid II flippase)